MKESEARDWARALELLWKRAGGMPAHQVEDPRKRMQSIDDRPEPSGALPVARFWRQRARYAGTYDDAWLREIWPSVPDDFDFRFYQSAHPDLIAEGYLSGHEGFILVNLTPEGEMRGQLPAFELFVLARDAAGIYDKIDLRLDTVYVDVEAKKLHLTWRYAFAEELGITHLLMATLVPPPQAGGDRLVLLHRSGGGVG
jgi:hypothetical protein